MSAGGNWQRSSSADTYARAADSKQRDARSVSESVRVGWLACSNACDRRTDEAELVADVLVDAPLARVHLSNETEVRLMPTASINAAHRFEDALVLAELAVQPRNVPLHHGLHATPVDASATAWTQGGSAILTEADVGSGVASVIVQMARYGCNCQPTGTSG